MERREFLKGSIATGMALALARKTAWAKSTDARIEIFINEPVGTISPAIYGQFTEHIGGVVYDGIWVGENSRIPNQFGIRSQLIEMLKQIRVPVIRWPGGCFADSYDWKDGVGPAAKRPIRTNFWEVDHDAARLHEKGPQIFEPNSFGTNEFMRFCKLTGAEPYLAANLRSLPPLSFDQWVEYCNSPAGSTTLAKLRAADGSEAPYNVKFWGIGNESWGCGGNFTPEEYASEFRRFTTWIPRYGVDLQLIGSGPNGNDIDWTHRFFEEIFTGPHAYENRLFSGWSIHHYSNDYRKRNGVLGTSDALAFDTVDWYDILRECDQINNIISDQWTTMGQFDRDHNVKLVVDEYGPWYREGTELDPTHIFGQQVTIRDALATAITLDAFNRNAEKVSVATNAQLINNINALFLAHEDRFFATPNFHVFAMYASHQGAQSLRTEFSASDIQYKADEKPVQFWGLNGSASRKENTITLTAVNPDIANSLTTQIVIRGAHPSHASALTLSAGDIHAHNTFDQPNAVKPHPISASIQEDSIFIDLPPASVAKLEVVIG